MMLEYYANWAQKSSVKVNRACFFLVWIYIYISDEHSCEVQTDDCGCVLMCTLAGLNTAGALQIRLEKY